METENQSNLEELLASYVDRLNDGEKLDAERILAENPLLGAELLDYLQDYVEASGSTYAAAPAPLGTLGDYTGWRQARVSSHSSASRRCKGR